MVCDGSKLYMSFCCLDTGLVANLYTLIKQTQPFSVVIKEITLNVKERIDSGWNVENNDSFAIYISSEVFAIVCEKTHWGSRLQTYANLFGGRVIQRTGLPGGTNVGIGIMNYTGLRPYNAVDSEGIVEYRRTKTSSIHFGVEGPLINRIRPESIIGIKPKHGRWLLNKAASSPTKEKGELIIHFKTNSVGFCGASPASGELSLEYASHGTGGGRGKYREYYNDGTEVSITVPRESIATKDLNSMVNYCDVMYIGVSGNKSILGWKVGDALLLWEQSMQNVSVHPMVLEKGTSLKELKCESFRLPNIANVFRLPDFLQGYERNKEEDEMTPEEARLTIHWWNSHLNSLAIRGKRPTKEEMELIKRLQERAK
jgi:hypothetical protein